MSASIEKRLRKLEQALAARRSQPMMPEFFCVWTDIKDVAAFERDAHAKCQAMQPQRYPFFIRFVGPPEGPELGTGPFIEDQDEDYDGDTLEEYQ